jgi:hypothetical protein
MHIVLRSRSSLAADPLVIWSTSNNSVAKVDSGEIQNRVEGATSTIATFEPNEYDRIVTIGNLPVDHDLSLVLKSGRSFKVALGQKIISEISSEGVRPLVVMESIYDDSGQVLCFLR